MSKIDRENFSEHDITPEESREKLKGGEKAGKLPHEFKHEITITDIETGKKESAERQGVLRYATPEDFNGIMNVDLDRWRYRAKKYGAQEYVGKKYEQEDIDNLMNNLAESSKGKTLVLTVDGEIAGYIAFGENYIKTNKFDENYFKPDNTTTQIYTVSVMEKYMKNGFATALLEYQIEEAEKYFGAKSIVLSTQKENRDALRVYIKDFGFRRGKIEVDKKRQWDICEDDPEKPGEKNCCRIFLSLDIEKWKEKKSKRVRN